jgi:ABC-2 type transport system ATP-binding protein
MNSVEELCDDIALINKSEKILEGNIADIKNANKENLFSVQFTMADNIDLSLCLPADIEIKSIEILRNGIITASLKIPKNQTANDLIKLLLSNVNLISFHEILPNMNDIFISYVNTILD